MLKSSNLITVACCLLPVASFHKSVFDRRARSKFYEKLGFCCIWNF
ncbi:MAG: hypothetical protein F6K31_01325 [Symploca sp. SIO2G7]|nr:hypothetical protein [Symploca sp. SIO2G7]